LDSAGDRDYRDATLVGVPEYNASAAYVILKIKLLLPHVRD
jgi:hypothetical protein